MAASIEGIPKISVALCTYNGARYLEQQLTSIFAQSQPPHEIVISDDHSRDGTLALIERLRRRTTLSVRVLQSATNQGVKANFEKAIRECSGNYIALADQDDVWLEDKLEVFSRAIAASDSATPALFYSDLDLIDSVGKRLGATFFARGRIVPPAADAWKFLATRNFAPGCSTVFDARLIKYLLPFPPESIVHDWWINLMFSLCGTVIQVDSPTMCYRVHPDNTRGIGSYARTLRLARQHGLSSLAAGNLAATINQARAAAGRLTECGLTYPVGLDSVNTLVQRLPALRPLILLREGIGRGNRMKTCLMLIASLFISERQMRAGREYV